MKIQVYAILKDHLYKDFTVDEQHRFIIDKIKHEAPIWKCEYFTDSSKEWGGNCKNITGDANKHVYEFEQKPAIHFKPE